MTNPIELLISLGVNNEESKKNINQYIKNLKTEDLNITLTVDSSKSNDKAFSDMQKRIEILQNKIKELNAQLGNIGNSKTKSGNIFIGVGKDLKQVQDQISSFLKNEGFQNFDFKINADVTDGEKTLKNFVANIRDAQGEVRKLTFMPDGTGSFKEIKESLSDTSITQYNKVLKDIDETLLSVNRSGILGAESIQDFNDKIKQINNSDITLDDKIGKLRTELNLLNHEIDETAFQNKLSKEMQNAEISVRNLASSLTKTTQTYKREASTMKNEIAELKKEIEDLSKIPIFKTQRDIDEFNSKLKQTQSNIRHLNSELTSANRSSITLISAIKTAFERFPIWLGVSTIIFGVSQAVKDLVNNIIELDGVLVDLRRVLDMPEYKFNEMLEKSIVNVERLSGRLTDYMSLVTEFSRMDFNTSDEILDMANTAQTLTNISDLDAKQSVDALMAARLAYNIEAERSIEIADKLNEIDNQYSVTTLQLGEALTKSAATASTFGVSLDELLSYITAISSSTREAGSVVGNSLKTIFARINTNDSAISALSDIGISIYDSTGQIKSASTLINEVASDWSSLTDEQRRNTAVGVAGIYQLSRWNALMLNYQTALDSATTSINSQLSATREQEKYNQSLEARINDLNTAWYSLSNTLGNTIFYDGIVAVTDVLESLADVGENAFGYYATLPVIFGVVGTSVFLLSTRMTGFTTSIIQNTAAQRLNTVASTTLTGKMYALAAGTGAASTAFRTFLGATGIGIGLIALGGIITVLTKAISENVQKQEEFDAQQNKNIEAITANKEQVSQLISEYERLNDTKNSSNSWNAEQEKEYLEVQQKLGDLFPSLISHVDSTGQAHLKNKEAIQEEIKATEDLIDAQNKMIVENASDEFGKLIDELNGSAFDSFSNFIYGSLKSQIDQQKNIIEAMYENSADSGAIAEAEFELKRLERQYQQTSEQIKGYIFDVADAISSIEINSNLSSTLQDFIYSLDLSNLNSNELESFAKEFGTIQEQLQKAMNSGNEGLFNSQINALNELASETNKFNKDLNSLILTYDKHNNTLSNKTNIIRVDTELTEESAESTTELADAFKDVTDSISFINGVLEEYTENNRISGDSMMDILEKYPQLLGYIGDESRLIQELQNIRNKDINLAKEQIAEKLSTNETFYNENLKALEDYFKEHFKFYDGDLKQFKTLAQAKADVESQLIEELSKGWAMFYNTATQQFQVDNWAVGSEAGQAAVESNEKLKEYRDTWNAFTLDRIDLELDSIGTSLDKNESKTKDSIYITDKYKQALEKLNLEIAKQEALRNGEANYSEKYRKSLEAQIKLEQEKLDLQRKQAIELENQIKSGKIQQTGNINNSTSSSAKLNGWNGTITSGYGNRVLNGKAEFHRGIDIDGYTGQRIDSNIRGKVIASGNASKNGYHSSYGNIVVVQDDKGQKHLYAHLEKAIAKLGDTITEGTQIGTIGSTGNSTGSHLHYEVNVNGKPVDPSEFITNAKNGIVSVVQGGQEAIDKAKSDLVSIQQDIIAQENKIAEMKQVELVDSYLSGFNRRRSIFEAEIDFEKTKLEELNTTSSRYSKTLDLINLYMNKKQKANKDELDYLTKAINSGEYQGEALDRLKDRYKALTTEMKATQIEIRKTNLELVNNAMTGYDAQLDDIQYEADRLKAIQSLYEEGSGDWLSIQEQLIQKQKETTEQTKAQYEALQQEIIARNLLGEDVKELTERLEDLSLAYWNSIGAEKELQKSLDESGKTSRNELADKFIESYKRVIEERKDMHMKELEEEEQAEEKKHNKRVKRLEDEMDLFRKNVQERIDLIDQEENERDYNNEISDLQSERNKIQSRFDLLALDNSNEAKAERKKLQEELDKIDKDIAERQHDRSIELQKDSLDNMLELKEEEINGRIEKENERYEEEIETINKQKEYWEKYYNDLVNDERKFAEIKKKIVEAKTKEQFDAIKSEFGIYLEDMKATMPELEDTLDGTMKAVGTSIRQNIIDELQEALDMLEQVESKSGVTSEYTKGGTSSSGNAKASTLSKGDMQVVLGKYMTEELAKQETNSVRKQNIRDKAYDLADLGRKNGSQFKSSDSLSSILSQLSEDDLKRLGNFIMSSSSNVVQTPYLQDFIKDFARRLLSGSARAYNGGMTPSTFGSLDNKGGRAMIVHPNELINSPIDTERLLQHSSMLERIARMISLPNLNNSNLATNGLGNIEINFNVDRMYGTNQEVESFSTKIANTIKTRFGGKL